MANKDFARHALLILVDVQASIECELKPEKISLSYLMYQIIFSLVMRY